MIKKGSLLLLLIFSIHTYANDKIVGGSRVQDFSEAAFMVSFIGECGGSIIDEQWILTAAHCKSILKKGSRAGSLRRSSGGISLEVTDVIIHPKFNPYNYNYDFALVKISSPIDFENSNIRKINISDETYFNSGLESEGVMSTVYGWGFERENGKISEYLNKVELPIVSNTTANLPDYYRGNIDDIVFAAGVAEGGIDACQGDSGGPLVTYNAFNEPILVGIVSWGVGCARENEYGIYSRVSAVSEWIRSTIQSN